MCLVVVRQDVVYGKIHIAVNNPQQDCHGGPVRGPRESKHEEVLGLAKEGQVGPAVGTTKDYSFRLDTI